MRFDQRTIVVLLVSTAYASWPTTGGGGTCGVEASAPFNPGTYYGNAYAQGNERNVNRNGNNAWPAQTSPQESAYDSYGQSSTAEPVSDLPPLPEGWSEHLDPASGQLYYYNANDGTTTWDRPLRLEDEAKAEEVQPPETNTRQNLSGADESRDNDNRATRMAESDVKETHADKMLDAESPQESDHEHKQHSSEDAWRNSASWDSPGEHDPESSPKEAPAEPERGAIPELDQHGWENQNMATADNSATEDFEQEGPGRDTGHFPAQRQPVVDNEQRLEGFSESQLNVDRPDQGPPTSHTGSWGAPRSVEQPRREQDVHERPYEPRSDHVSADTFGRHVPDANRPQPEKQLLPVQHQDQYGVNPRSSVFGLVPEPHNPQQYQRTSPQQSIHRDPEQSVPIQEREQYQERPGTAMPPRQQIMQQHPYGQQRPTHPQQLQQQGPPSQSRVLPPQYQQQQPHPQQQQQQSHHGQYGGPYGQPYGGPYGQYGQPSHGVNTPRGYGTQQQSQQPQRQLISEDTTRPVKEALGRTWQSILGLSNRTKEAVDHARESVVTGAKGASQSLSTTSASWWGQAKNTFGSVFENENGQPSQYSLSGQYGGQREQVIRGPPPGYPPQQGGHPAHGQPQYPPPMHHQGGGYPTYPGQQYPPGYGPPQPRSDPSYPHDPQYRPPAQSQQPPLQAQWGQQQHYPPQYQQGGPGGPRGGPGSPQQRQPQQNEQRPPPRPQGGPSPDTDDPWQHPGLGTDGY